MVSFVLMGWRDFFINILGEIKMEKRITGHTELLGLVATPIRHSKSPVMHNAACRALGLDYAYLAFDIQPDQL